MGSLKSRADKKVVIFWMTEWMFRKSLSEKKVEGKGNSTVQRLFSLEDFVVILSSKQ